MTRCMYGETVNGLNGSCFDHEPDGEPDDALHGQRCRELQREPTV